MIDREQPEVLWAVVFVWRGFPNLVEIYRDKELAFKRERQLRMNLNPDYDEVDVFETQIIDAIPPDPV